ncbi:MAG TPA: hypothetical protein VM783_17990 [Candidatus Acidoferrum sp.]|nr:hypothetical protein [Candidatus Acidoferrum sp.]
MAIIREEWVHQIKVELSMNSDGKYMAVVRAPNEYAASKALHSVCHQHFDVRGLRWQAAPANKERGVYWYDLQVGEGVLVKRPYKFDPGMPTHPTENFAQQCLINADLSKLEEYIMQSIPKEQVAYATVPNSGAFSDPAAAVAAAKRALEDAEAALTAKIERDEFERRINAEMELASVTHTLLRDIRDSGKIGRSPDTRCDFAKFRKELQPLAESYGYKIVLVGDKSLATLVKV